MRQVIIDPITNAPLIRNFPIESIEQLKNLLVNAPNGYYVRGLLEKITLLKNLLVNAPNGYNVKGLLEKITMGLKVITTAAYKITLLKNEYDTFTPEQQYIAKLYLAWLFMYGMWMRFWKGPGNPWPITIECRPEERDEHIFIQNGIRTVLIEAYEKDPKLKEWIESLVILYHNVYTGEVILSRNPVINEIKRVALGIQCQGMAAEPFIQTAYYMIMVLFNFNYIEQFNNFITEMMPIIFNIEKQVVDYQLAHIKNPHLKEVRIRVKVLRELKKPIPKQPGFNPKIIRPDIHV